MINRIPRYLLIPLVIGVFGIFVYLVFFMRPLLVDVTQPTENISVKVFGLGTVEARVQSNVGFEVGAALIELNVDHGDRVKKDDVLASLYSADQESRLAKAGAGVLNAEAALNMAESAVGKARAVLAQKKQSNKRKQALAARNTISVETVEEAQTEEDVAAAELAVAISAVEVARAAVKDAKSQFKYEQVLLGHYVLRAPYDAIVVKRHKELGTVMTPGEALFTLVAPETVWTLAYVDEANAGNLRVGQPAEIHLRSLPQQVFEGHVARIDIESDRVNEERRVYIACDRCPESFYLGEQAEVYVTTNTIDQAILVPETAIEHLNGTNGFVWMIEDGKLHYRKVAFGHRTLDSRLEIIDVLPKGASVVSKLRSGLKAGRSAKPRGGKSP
ncbi:efflux RND transporter periplasmic adaptor subunit [Emcibacter sp.]|uniref:efflux RND transporter periplasmic adaptor subunit n=1 Tax=Emcibacter sp. TaxID=1979954 RepID=UPI002AA75BA2|nr:efflux RND transporter periplasmic adaptor subunit [Emcibacter sp.]